jgi:hypothetical protein
MKIVKNSIHHYGVNQNNKIGKRKMQMDKIRINRRIRMETLKLVIYLDLLRT